MIDYDTLKGWCFAPVMQRYDPRDCRLYALGLNLGNDPLDRDALRYVADEPPAVVCMMPMTLARPASWLRDPATGIDYSRVMVGEIALRLHAPLPPEAQVEGRHRVLRVTDKGAGRGALVTLLREIYATDTGKLLAEYEQVTFCRGDGGFAVDGRHDPAPDGPGWETPAHAPDAEIALQTAPQQALIYRLSGDMNPLHADPDVARRSGFDRPILHGLSTMGMVGHALDRGSQMAGRPGIAGLRARLSAPVFPGEELLLLVWRAEDAALFCAVNGEGREVVSRGIANFHNMD